MKSETGYTYLVAGLLSPWSAWLAEKRASLAADFFRWNMYLSSSMDPQICLLDALLWQASFLKKFFPATYRDIASHLSTSAYCTFAATSIQLFTSSLFPAAAFSGLAAAPSQKKYGRKKIIIAFLASSF